MSAQERGTSAAQAVEEAAHGRVGHEVKWSERKDAPREQAPPRERRRREKRDPSPPKENAPRKDEQSPQIGDLAMGRALQALEKRVEQLEWGRSLDCQAVDGLACAVANLEKSFEARDRVVAAELRDLRGRPPVLPRGDGLPWFLRVVLALSSLDRLL